MKLTNKQLNRIEDIHFRYDLHYKLWDWLSKHPDKNKADYFLKHKTADIFSGPCSCYACDYSIKVYQRLILDEGKSAEGVSHCAYCPLKANNSKSCLGGLYDTWFNLKYKGKAIKRRSLVAMKIRDLPLAEMYNFENLK